MAIAPRLLEALWGAPFVLPNGDTRRVTGSVGFAVLPLGAGVRLEPRARDWESTSRWPITRSTG